MVAQNWRQEVKLRLFFFFSSCDGTFRLNRSLISHVVTVHLSEINAASFRSSDFIFIIYYFIFLFHSVFRCSRSAALLQLPLLLLLFLIQGNIMAHASTNNNELRFTLSCNPITFRSERLQSFPPNTSECDSSVCAVKNVLRTTFVLVRTPESERNVHRTTCPAAFQTFTSLSKCERLF